MYQTIAKMDLRNVIMKLETERSEINLLLNQIAVTELDVSKLGLVRNLNVPQYIFAKLLVSKKDVDEFDYYYRLLYVVMPRCSQDVLKHEDSKRNNIFFYIALFNDVAILNMVVQKGIEPKKNSNGIYPHLICQHPEMKQILKSYQRRFQMGISEVFETKNVKRMKISTGMGDALAMNGATGVLKDNKGIDFNKLNEYKSFKIETNHLGNKNIFESVSEEVRIKKFPGTLYFIINKVSDLQLKSNLDSVFFTLATPTDTQVSKSHSAAISNVREVFAIPVTSGGPMKLELILYGCYQTKPMFSSVAETKTKKLGSLQLDVTSEILDNSHNSLLKSNFSLLSQTSILGLLNLAYQQVGQVSGFFSFISHGELQYVESEYPKNLDLLLRWLKIRKISSFIWFKGFSNVKTNRSDFMTTLWKRRLIQWQGIYLSIFNEHGSAFIAKLDMTTLIKYTTNETKMDCLSREATLEFQDQNFDLNFESEDLFSSFVKSLEIFLNV